MFPVAKSLSICERLENLYLRIVKDLFLFLHKRKWDFFAGFVITFLIEPHNAIRAGYLMQKGLDRERFKNLNPKKLSLDQLKCPPVLLIHGDSSNSGLFAPMIEQIAKEAPHTPVFTIDLTSSDGTVSAKKHLNVLVAKVEEIKALYPSSMCPKISFVGHSSGGDVLGPLVQMMNARNWKNSPTIIKIGSVFKKSEEASETCHHSHGKVIEILGTKDIFEGCNSILPNKLVVCSGHLGLLFNKKVLERVSREIVNLGMY